MTETSRKENKKTKKKLWIKLYPERWLFGSSREELTNAERAVWIDFLALAAMNDPLGQVDFMSYKRLAYQLNISVRLLTSVINKALAYGKIELRQMPFGSKFNEKEQIVSPNDDQTVTKNANFGHSQSKIGLTLRTIKILKWDEYQSEYMRQKPHREKRKEQEEEQLEESKKLQKSGLKAVSQVTDRGEERRKEEKRKEEKRAEQFTPNKNSSNFPLPSNSNSFKGGGITIKEQFLSMLKGCNGYPFDELQDSLLFDITFEDCPGINIIKQTEKKIAWWRDHSDALKANPREKIREWFKEEFKFKKRGKPQKVGEIMQAVKDPSHRRFLEGFFKKKPKKENLE